MIQRKTNKERVGKGKGGEGGGGGRIGEENGEEKR